MIDAFGGDRWWPLNSQFAVLSTTTDRVAEALNPGGRAVIGRYPDLETAVADRAPFPLAGDDTYFLIATNDGATAVLSSAAPSADGLADLGWSAEHRLSCDWVYAGWAPAHRDRLAAAGFDHLQYTPPLPSAPGGRSHDELSVQVSDQGRRWVFTRLPPGAGFAARAYEEPEVYRARVTADRLPLDLIRRYLAAAGVPVDDPGYLAGPVVTVGQPKRIPSAYTWSDMADLRAVAGYPAAGRPTDLRALPQFDDA